MMIRVDRHDVLVPRNGPVGANWLHVCRSLVRHPAFFAIM